MNGYDPYAPPSNQAGQSPSDLYSRALYEAAMRGPQTAPQGTGEMLQNPRVTQNTSGKVDKPKAGGKDSSKMWDAAMIAAANAVAGMANNMPQPPGAPNAGAAHQVAPQGLPTAPVQLNSSLLGTYTR